jgi:ATP-dependent DNA ligase
VRYEAKLDGVRAAVLVDADRAVLQSRTDNDLGPRFPQLATALAALPPGR